MGSKKNCLTKNLFEKCRKGPPFEPVIKGKIKIAHLLPECIAPRDDHFSQTLVFFRRAEIKNAWPKPNRVFENGLDRKISKLMGLRRYPVFFGDGASAPQEQWDRPIQLINFTHQPIFKRQ